MRILGIDCGTVATGYGLIETGGRGARLIEAGTIRPSPRDPMEKRLREIGCALRLVIERARPDHAAIEGIFHAANARSAFKLAQVRGVALFVLAESGVPVGEYSPLEVKSSVVGFGRAEKEQVQWMLPSLLGYSGPLDSADAADAVAVAYCHSVHLPAGAAQ
ncbi:MAG: crossover junction endodeoxyribonuclease RuvC [Bryobacterales bacterium]|nr:crossover junction endodeoxyribonuclease RuvC [Bryobacterales bacterium]